MDQPWPRLGFFHDNLLTWVDEQHGHLIWAALVLVQYGLERDRPAPKSKPLGSYEAWSNVIGGILESAEIPGFLSSYCQVQPLPHPGEAWGELRWATDAAILALNNAPQTLEPEQATQRRELAILVEMAQGMLRQYDRTPQ